MNNDSPNQNNPFRKVKPLDKTTVNWVSYILTKLSEYRNQLDPKSTEFCTNIDRKAERDGDALQLSVPQLNWLDDLATKCLGKDGYIELKMYHITNHAE